MRTITFILFFLNTCFGFSQPLSGTITIGSSGDFPDFTSSTGLFQHINNNGLNGNLQVNIISNLTEVGTIGLNEWVEIPTNSNYIILITSNNDTEKIITCNTTNIVFKFNGSDRVHFDGRYNGSGHYLNFQGRSTVFQYLNGANNNSLINLKISSASANSGSVAFATGTNSNNLVENCIISNRYPTTNFPKHGIHSYDLANQDNLLINNFIYGFLETGIYIEFGDNFNIKLNEITSENGTRGIVCKSFNTLNIESNWIYNINGISPSPQNSYGIYLDFYSNSGSNSEINIINNMISLNHPLPGNINGISLYGSNAFQITANVFHNSVYIYGSEDSARSANGVSQNNISTFNFLNNLIINTRENTQAALQGKSRCVSFNTNSGFSNIVSNYNLYYNLGMNTWIGQWNAILVDNMIDWQTNTSQDVNSKNKNVSFLTNTDLHLTGTSDGDTDLAVPILSFVLEDYDAEFRNTNTYLGCDEAATTLSEQNVIFEDAYSIYPNPTKDIININVQNEVVITEIYDFTGKLILTTNTNKIDISNFNNGIYIFKLSTDKKSEIKKIIKY